IDGRLKSYQLYQNLQLWNKFYVQLTEPTELVVGEDFVLNVVTKNLSEGELNCPGGPLPSISFAWETSPGEWKLQPVQIDYIDECMLPADGRSNTITGKVPSDCDATEGYILIGDHGLPPALVSDPIGIVKP
ncbi:MAG: hypothetical protein HRT74_12255, partial [Flavobacteriales bacterium]|nr:hypothetical protein [Flavobacteriales bacterium]